MTRLTGENKILIGDEGQSWTYELQDGQLILRENDSIKVIRERRDFEDFLDAFFEVYCCSEYGDEILNVLDNATPLLKEVGIEISRIERAYINRTYEALLGIKVPGIYENYRLYHSVLEWEDGFEDEVDYLTLAEAKEWIESYRQDLQAQLAQLN